jgi:hypothetical protein
MTFTALAIFGADTAGLPPQDVPAEQRVGSSHGSRWTMDRDAKGTTALAHFATQAPEPAHCPEAGPVTPAYGHGASDAEQEIGPTIAISNV